jgi:hypothetical protein
MSGDPPGWKNPVKTMNCPEEIAEIVLEIVRIGLLNLRASGWSGDGLLCAVESDHIHNLPILLERYSPEMLRYYWDVERTSYATQVPAARLAVWEPLWRRLREHVEPPTPSSFVKCD